MFDVGFGELLVLGVVALFVFGPDKLPKAAADAARGLRELRRLAQGAREQLTESIDPELKSIDIKDLDPREFVRKTLLEVDDAVEGQPHRGQNGHGSAKPRSIEREPGLNGSGGGSTSGSPAAWDNDTT